MSAAAPEVNVRRRRPTLPPRPPWLRLDVCVLALLLVIGLAAPLLVSLLGLKGPDVRDPSAVNLFGNPTGPSGAHPLGVDASGRDELSRILYGLRALLLVSGAGAAVAVLVSGLLGGLCTLAAGRLPDRRAGRWPAAAWDVARSGVGAFPPLLFGLAVGLSLGPGDTRLIVAIAITQLSAVPSAAGVGTGGTPAMFAGAGASWVGRGFAAVLPSALAIEFGLSFLDDGPHGSAPQLGAMVARAGGGIVVGIPAWWALLFPGLAALLVLLAARSVAGWLAPPVALRNVSAGEVHPTLAVGVAALRAGIVIAVATVAFTALGGRNPGHLAPLARVGPDLAATVSLLAGGLLVWLTVTYAQLRWLTRPARRGARSAAGAADGTGGAGAADGTGGAGARGVTGAVGGVVSTVFRSLGKTVDIVSVRAPVRLVTAAGALLAAAPVGWLAFLALYAFSESVGKLPVLPGAATYVGLTHDPGRWAEALVMPWLALGLTQAARIAPALARSHTRIAEGGQQRVARGAGVPAGVRSAQRRRALAGPVIALTEQSLGALIGAVVIVEWSFRLPGVGSLAVSAFGEGHSATVADLAVLAALLVIAVGLGLATVGQRLLPSTPAP